MNYINTQEYGKRAIDDENRVNVSTVNKNNLENIKLQKSHLLHYNALQKWEHEHIKLYNVKPNIDNMVVKFLINGNWNGRFIDQICTFPNATHDEYVDLIGYACFHYFDKGKRRDIQIHDFSDYRR